MTQENMYNPFLLWKTMYEATESNLSKAIDETLRTKEYAEFLGNVQAAYLQYQDLIQSTTDTYLNQLNIPTRDEISSIASLVINVEDKVEDLAETMEEDERIESITSEITNIKRGVSRVERKLNQVLDELKKEEDTPAKKTTTEDKK